MVHVVSFTPVISLSAWLNTGPDKSKSTTMIVDGQSRAIWTSTFSVLRKLRLCDCCTLNTGSWLTALYGSDLTEDKFMWVSKLQSHEWRAKRLKNSRSSGHCLVGILILSISDCLSFPSHAGSVSQVLTT